MTAEAENGVPPVVSYPRRRWWVKGEWVPFTDEEQIEADWRDALEEDAQRSPILKLQAELREARAEAARLGARGDRLFVALDELRDTAEQFASVLAEYIGNNGDWVHEDKDGYENTKCPKDADCTCASLAAVNEAEAKRIGPDVLVAHLDRVGRSVEPLLHMWVEEGKSYRGSTAAASDVKETLFMARAMETVMQNKTFVAAIKLDLFGVKTPPVVVECKRCKLAKTEGEEHDCVHELLLQVGRLREIIAMKDGAT